LADGLQLLDAHCEGRIFNERACHRDEQLRAGGENTPNAGRILPRTWTHIILRFCQDRAPKTQPHTTHLNAQNGAC
jgi:hypothetical protein